MTSGAKDSLSGPVGPSGATVPHRFRTALEAPSSGCPRGLALVGSRARGDLGEDSRWEPAEAVARPAASAFSPKRAVVLSDAPPLDQVWLDRLFIAGDVRMRAHLLDIWQTLRRVASDTLREAGVPDAAAPDILGGIREGARRADEARGPVAHRALADARRSASTWRDVIRRAEEAGVAWRRANPEDQSQEAAPCPPTRPTQSSRPRPGASPPRTWTATSTTSPSCSPNRAITARTAGPTRRGRWPTCWTRS